VSTVEVDVSTVVTVDVSTVGLMHDDVSAELINEGYKAANDATNNAASMRRAFISISLNQYIV